MADVKYSVSIDSSGAEKGARKVNDSLKDTRKTSERASKSIKNLGSRLNKVRKSVVSWQGALSAAAGTAGLGYLINRTINATAEIERNAQMAGVSTKAYQELSYVAKQYQISNDALTDGLKELSLRADEFIQTSKGASADAFKRLGYTQEELNRKLNDTPALLSEISSRMRELDRAAQIRIADELFGGQGGEQFMKMLRSGATEINNLKKRAHELGLVMDEDLIESSVEAKKDISTLVDVISIRFQSAVADLAPEIGEAAENMSDWVTANDDFLTQKIPGAIDSFASSIKGVANSKEFKFLVDNWEVIAGMVVGSRFGPWGTLAGLGLGAVGKAENQQQVGLPENMKGLGQGGTQSTGNIRLNIPLDKQKETKTPTPSPTPSPSRGGEPDYPTWPETGFTGRGMTDMWLIRNQGMKDAAERADDMLDAQKDIREEMETTAHYAETSGDRIDTMYAGLSQGLAEYSNRYSNAADRIKNMTSSITYSMESSFSSFLDVTSDKFMDFRNLVTQILGDIQRQMVRSMIVQPLMSNMSNMFMAGGMNTGAPAHVGAGGTTAFGMHTGGIVGKEYSFKKDIPKFHDGGIASDETPAILKRDEGVFTKEQMKAMGNVSVQVIDQRSSGEQIETRTERKNGKTNVTLLVRDEVRKTIGSGGADKTMRNSFNINRSPIRR